MEIPLPKVHPLKRENTYAMKPSWKELNTLSCGNSAQGQWPFNVIWMKTQFPPAWCVSRPYVIPLLFIGRDCWVYIEELLYVISKYLFGVFFATPVLTWVRKCLWNFCSRTDPLCSLASYTLIPGIQVCSQPSVIRGGSAPRSNAILSPFIYHFWQKRYPFCIPSIDKWYPLKRTYLVWNLASLSTAVK